MLETAHRIPKNAPSSKEPPSYAVIGAGMGGLAAAIRLQAHGRSVVLYERRDLLGGRAYVYKQDGFTFDAGPTVLTAPECIDELFMLSGEKREDWVDLLPVDPFYRLQWNDGTYFDYTNDSERLESQIKKLMPEDVEGYKKFLNYSKEVYDKGYKELVHVPFLTFGSMLKVAPDLIRLKAHKSVYKMVSKYIKHPKLREAFSFHSLLVGGNPFQTSSIYTLIHFLERSGGVWFARGGTGALIQAFQKLFVKLGGVVRTNAPVKTILTDDGKVTGVELMSGERIPHTAVVSNADIVHTYEQLMRHEHRAFPMRAKARRMRLSMSLFLIYFGTKKRYPDVEHHTILFADRYKGLLDELFKKGQIPNDFSLYLHRPTKTDLSMAPPGCDSFYVLAPVPHLGQMNPKWRQYKDEYADKILSFLESVILPDLKANIVTQRIFHPEDFEDQLLAHKGNAFSFAPTLLQSAWFRMHNRDPHVKGLYFVGAGTHPGAGVPGVINSAKATVRTILSDFKEREVAGEVRL